MSLVQSVVIFGVPMLLFFVFVLLVLLAVAIYFHFRGSSRPDALEVMFRELVQLARINADPLYRDIYMTYHDETRPIWKGSYLGHNRINLYTSGEELYQPAFDTDRGVYYFELEQGETFRKYEIPSEEWDRVKEKLDATGGSMYVVVYSIDWGWKIPLLWKNTIVKAVLAYKSQVVFSPGDGRIVLNAPGTETHGVYFEIPSGDRDQTTITVSAIQTLTWIRMLAQNQGNIFDITNKSLDVNPTLAQILAVRTVEKSTKSEKKD